MKILPVLLAASLAANLAFAAHYLSRRNAAIAVNSQPLAAEPRAPKPDLHPATAAGIASPEPVAPGRLASDDFGGLATRLSNAGVPQHLAEFTVGYAIKLHFDRRRDELGLRSGSLVRNPITNATSESAEITSVRARVDAEERAAMREHAASVGKMSGDAQRQITGTLPDKKAQQLLKIFMDYREMETQLYVENPNRAAPETREKVALLEKERRADIERLLTAEELLEYDLRNSGTGQMIRNRLGMFVISEPEFRALHAALKTAEQSANAAGVPQRKRDRDAVYEPEIRRVLGEARYADLKAAEAAEAARVKAFGEAMNFTRALNLPSTAANDLLVLQADLRPRLAALEAARAATPDQRDAQIAALAREARARLTVLLGEKGFAEYRQRGGQWLEPSLARAAPP